MGINKAGITLTELLVAIVLMSILTGIALPKYFKVVEKARSAEAINCINVLTGAFNVALIRTGTFPNVGNVINPGAVLESNCVGLKYFTGSATGGGTSYTITLTRNGYKFRTFESVAPANYTVTYTHNEGATPAWGGTVPSEWLPQ